MSRLTEEKDNIVSIVREAASQYLCIEPSEIRKKGEYDLVTKTDFDIESFIVGSIRKSFHEDCIMGEEFTPDMLIGKGRLWTVDPIDGTVNYARGSTEYGVQCSLIIDGIIQMSVVYLPTKDEMFWAIKGKGAFCNDEQINVNKSTIISESVVYMGDFSHKEEFKRQVQIQAINYLSSRVSKIRMVGAACIDYSTVASGKADGLISITRNPWDISPGILLCEEAGAIVTDLYGDDYRFGADGVIVASTMELSMELRGSLCKDMI